MIPGSANPLLLATAAGAGGGYAIERSLRFNSADSAHLSKTFASAGNRKTWTWAGWVKASASTVARFFAGENASGHRFYIDLSSGNLRVGHNNGSWNIILNTTQVFRDFSAWFHIVVLVDTTQATSSDRVKLYVNGVQITSFSSSTYPAQNLDTIVNEASASLYIGYGGVANGAGYLDGYLADIHFIDGQALDPTSFGEFDDNGIWQPIAYSGTYGTNGFHLPFSDNSTAASLGDDTSGNNNDWTVNNITAVAPSYSSPTNANTPVYDITIGPTNPLSGVGVWSDAFNGDSNSYGLIGPITFINTKPTWSTSTGVELMAAGNGITASVNGGTQVALTNNAFVTISSGSSGTLNSIWIYNSAGSSSIRRVRVDGVDISVRALFGSASDIDSLVDVPTNGTEEDTGIGAEVRGNYCTWNPLANFLTLANGNLNASQASAAHHTVYGTVGVSSGKWYWEITKNDDNSASNTSLGLAVAVTSFVEDGAAYISTAGTNTGYLSGDLQLYDGADGFERAITVPGGSHAAGTWMFAFDFDSGKGWLGKDGTWFSNTSAGNEGDPATGANPCFNAFIPGATYVPLLGMYAATNVDANFGQRPFAYTAPSGFKALCTANLPAPTIEDPSTVMDVALYTGNGSSQTISGLNMSPDLVWIKGRSSALQTHVLVDTVRGVSRMLQSNATAVELNDPGYYVSAFNSDGFDVTDNTNGSYNVNGSVGGTFSGAAQYAAWTWDAGSSTVTNNDGSITSSVRTNNYLSIVTYTGTGSAATVGHGLGVAPKMVFTKCRGATSDWGVYHASVGATAYLRLNLTNASSTGAGPWNNTAPTSAVFSVGTNAATNSANTMVAYCFAPVESYSAFGSYTGNGSADGPFVYTGFRPRWILIKSSSLALDWCIFDAARDGYNANNDSLYPNSGQVENNFVLSNELDILSNGFKARANRDRINQSSATYVWAAFAENPFALNARAR